MSKIAPYLAMAIQTEQMLKENLACGKMDTCDGFPDDCLTCPKFDGNKIVSQGEKQ